jgi:hypothetical protein
MKPNLILFYTHFFSAAVKRELARLRAEMDSRYDIIAAGYCRIAGALDGIDCAPVREYSADELTAMPYPGKVRQFDPQNYFGNADMVPMKVFLDQPDYNYYWIMEYDVRFSGKWPELFADLSSSRADLLCTTLQAWTENPNWAHWRTLATGGEDVSMERRVKGFMPFCRLSQALLQAWTRAIAKDGAAIPRSSGLRSRASRGCGWRISAVMAASHRRNAAGATTATLLRNGRSSRARSFIGPRSPIATCSGRNAISPARCGIR